MSIFFSPEFIEFISESIPVGQKWYANENRKHIYKWNKEYYSVLDFDNDQPFLHPLLLPHFLRGNGSASTEQLLFEFLPMGSEVPVKSDKSGIVYLAGTGFFATNSPLTDFIVRKTENAPLLFHEHQAVDVDFTPIQKIQGTRIELPLFELPYTRHEMMYSEEVKANTEYRNISALQIDHVQQACDIIRDHFPLFYDWFTTSIQSIQVLNNPEIWSFATISTLGISYLSATPERSILFFLEDIIHQSAHNIFYNVNYFSKNELFELSSEARMTDFMNDGDERNIYGVFHGLFTQSNINIFLNLVLDKSLFSGELHHEALGRLADNMNRWKTSLSKFGKPGVLSEIGEQYYNEFKEIYDALEAKWGEKLSKFDTSNQPYIFSFEKFVELNPMAR